MSALSPVGSPVFLGVAQYWRVRSKASSRLTALTSPATQAVPAPEGRPTLAEAADGLRAAYANLTRRLQPAHSVHWVAETIPGSGHAATIATLAATRRVNESSSPVRTSSVALGLDLTEGQFA